MSDLLDWDWRLSYNIIDYPFYQCELEYTTDIRLDEGAGILRHLPQIFHIFGRQFLIILHTEVRLRIVLISDKNIHFDKVKELLGDAQIDESRLLMEVTIFADKVCVDEELVRLKSHIETTKENLFPNNRSRLYHSIF